VNVPSENSPVWRYGFGIVLLWLAVDLCIHIDKPFIGYHEWGSALWAQTAHNNLRAGLTTTWGVPSGTYCGPLPIPQNGYFIDHPPLLPLAVTAMFGLFGEQEWAARLIPIICSIMTAVLLWLVIGSCAGMRAATLSAAVFAFQPMELYFGRVVDHEACGLMWIMAFVFCLRRCHMANDARWRNAALACLFSGMWTAWPVYILAGVACWFLLATRRAADKRLAWMIFATTALSILLYLLHIRLVRADAWEMFLGVGRFRLGIGTRTEAGIPWGPWAARQFEYLTLRFSPAAWGLALIGAICLIKRRTTSEGIRWLGLATAGTFLIALLWIVGFRNGAYIHSFWGFYFLAPLSVGAGLGLEALLTLNEGKDGRQTARILGFSTAFIALVLQAGWGTIGTAQLHRGQHTISGETEPHDLLPTLGRAIREEFGEETFIITNLPNQNMPLEYYAHRNFIYFPTIEGWNEVFRHQGNRCRGLIWMEAPGASELVAAMPAGKQRLIRLGDLSFCLWKPADA